MGPPRIAKHAEAISEVYESIGGRRVIPVIPVREAFHIGGEAPGGIAAPHGRFGVWFFLVVLFNAALLLAAYMLATQFASRTLGWSFKRTFATFSYMFVPIVLVTIGGHSLRYFFEEIWGQMLSVTSAPLGVYAYHESTAFSPATIGFIGNDFVGPVLYAAGFLGTMVLPYAIAFHRERDHRRALRAALPFFIIATAIAGYCLWSHQAYSGGTWRW